MFPDYPIDSITNGVHAHTWTGRAVPGAVRPAHSRVAARQPVSALRGRHSARGDPRRARGQRRPRCFAEVRARTGVKLDPAVITIGFARRATPYKRADLIFSDLERLKAIARSARARSRSSSAARRIRTTGAARSSIRQHLSPRREQLGDLVQVVYVENYEMDIARPDDVGRRPLAEQSDEAARGERHERDEGGAQRRALVLACSMAGGWRGTSRASPAGRSAAGARGGSDDEMRGSLRQARARDPAALLRTAVRVRRR